MQMKRVAEDDRPRTTKLIYFYKSGDSKFQGLRIPVNARRYRTLDALLDDLSYRIPGLSYGARRLATPRGRHMVKKVDDLSHLASYICTDKLNAKRVPGVEVDKLTSGSDYQFRGAFMNNTPQALPTSPKKKKKIGSPSKKKKVIRTASEPTAEPKPDHVRKPRLRKRVSKKRDRPTQSEPKVKAQSKSPHKSSKSTGKKATKTTLSSLRTLRSSHSAPETERGEPVGELSPLDSNKLRHVQRRRIATKKVPSATTESGDSLPPKIPKKKKKKKVKSKSPNKSASINKEGTNVTLVDNRRKEAWTEDENQAATKIQSHYRGYRARKQYEVMKEENESSKTPTSPRSTPNESEKESAAITIQSHYRGYKSRHDGNTHRLAAIDDDDDRTAVSDLDDDDESTSPISTRSAAVTRPVTEVSNSDSGGGSQSRSGTAQSRPKSIMIEDEAAVKIQAAYRGYITRKQSKQRGASPTRMPTPHPRKEGSRSGSRLTDSGVSLIEPDRGEMVQV